MTEYQIEYWSNGYLLTIVGISFNFQKYFQQLVNFLCKFEYF